MSAENVKKGGLAIVPAAPATTAVDLGGAKIAAQTITEVTLSYLARLPRDYDPLTAAQGLVNQTNEQLFIENEGKLDKTAKDKLLTTPTPWQTAMLAIHLLGFVRVVHPLDIDVLAEGDVVDVDLGQVAMRQRGDDVYTVSTVAHRAALRAFDPNLSARGYAELDDLLKENAPVRVLTMDRGLVPVQNGVFVFSSKTLRTYSDEDVFLNKCPIPYCRDALDTPIVMPDGAEWTFEGWMAELQPDPEVVQVLWEVLAAVVRSAQRHKAVLLVSEAGNNGKGTLLQVATDLVGQRSTIEMSIDAFAKDSVMVRAAGKALITGNENQTGSRLENVQNFKAAVTRDPITVERKYMTSITIRSTAFVLQSVNAEALRSADSSGSFWRRLVLVPFVGTFSGRERTYIKDDYLRRPEVLQYLLKRLLEMDFEEISEPAACLALKNNAKLANNRVLEFWNERGNAFVWDALPLTFLHELFGAWMKKTNPGSPQMGQSKFFEEVTRIATATGMWTRPEGRQRPGKSMIASEPMAIEFGIDTRIYQKNNPTQVLRRAEGLVVASSLMSAAAIAMDRQTLVALDKEDADLTRLLATPGIDHYLASVLMARLGDVRGKHAMITRDLRAADEAAKKFAEMEA